MSKEKDTSVENEQIQARADRFSDLMNEGLSHFWKAILHMHVQMVSSYSR